MKYAFIVISALLLIAMGPKAPSGDAMSPFEGDGLVSTSAPDFTLRDVTGKEVTLSSFRGKVVVLNFWATWCPPCKAEMPSLNKLFLECRPKGLEVITVSTDRSLGDVKDFLARNRLDLPVLFDEKKTVTKQYKVFSMPTTFLINRQGVIVERLFGEYDWMDRETRQKIEKLL